MRHPEIEDVFALAPGQEALLTPVTVPAGSQVPVEQHVILLRGYLDVQSLRRAWQRVVDRHAGLRTVFARNPDGRPSQRVLSEALLTWIEEDWRGREAVGLKEALDAFLLADREDGLDIAQGPPLRVSIIRTTDDEHHIVWTFHPILLDAKSTTIVSREVAACYEAFVRGAEPELQPARPYRDYVEWLQGRDPAPAKAFWARFLDGYDTPGRLDGLGRLAAGTHAEQVDLSEAMTKGLRSFSEEHRLEPGSIFRAVWALLLGRHTGESDIVFGASFPGRPRDLNGSESIVGLLAGPLPVRVQITEGESFLAMVKRLQGVEAELRRHRHAPISPETIWSAVTPGTPPFETLVVCDDDSAETPAPLALPGMAADTARSWARSNCPLHLQIAVRSRFRLTLSYERQRFDAETIRSLLLQIPAVLGQALARPEIPLDQLSLVTPESAPVLPDPSGPLVREEFPSVAAQFDSWASRAPQAPALRQHGRTLTYAELSRRARAVARALRDRGCQGGDVVALDGWPGFGLITSLLGILQAGGVALMLDRRLPLERRRVMSREAGAKHLVRLDASVARESWEDLAWTAVASVDLASGELLGPPETSDSVVLPAVNGDDPAYIFFTSGTTGVPKGVLGTHRGLSHFLAWQRTAFGVGPGDRSSQLTGLSFDVVLREIFLPLTSGATLCLPDEPEELGAERILPWLDREGVTTLHTVPTLADTWLLTPPPGVSLSALKRVFFAGEPLSGRLVQRWRTAFGTSARIVNLYGPTETTLAKCFYLVPDEPGAGVQPVGRPLPQSQALVLADGGRLCGVGEWGEIAIRTPYRTRGYVNVPEENARRFRPNPARPDGQDLVYHTGDRGRFRADGLLEISGRLDDQVKIRGVRVEPGETAAVLDQHPSVRRSVVLGQKGPGGMVRLVAYVVPESGASPTVLDLKSFLGARLTESMIPSAFVFLERMPLTPNGKVDRTTLATMTAPEPSSHAGLAAPRTDTERTVAAIWAEVLGVENVGVEENFFDLGGNSLLMLAVLTRARARGFDLENLTMFRFPTVRSLAEHLDSPAVRPSGHQDARTRGQRQREAVNRVKRTTGRP